VLMVPDGMFRSWDAVRMVCADPSRFVLCAQYDVVAFARQVCALAGQRMESIFYPAPPEALQFCDVLDVPFTAHGYLAADLEVSLADGETAIRNAMKASTVREAQGATCLWMTGDSPRDRLTNVQFGWLLEGLKEKGCTSPVLMGKPSRADEEFEGTVLTSAFEDGLELLAYLMTAERLIGLDSWVTRFAAHLGVPTTIIMGTYDDEVPGRVVANGPRCDGCPAECTQTICTRLSRMGSETRCAA